ncbi:MAG: VOC family protein [Chloroflexi bacterium]|nr:VOC family protein [Chloroflexota bacterium]
MDLGQFSVSLAVKDLKASRAFYEKLGFKQIDGVEEQNWVILQSGTTTIGLFQGMFEHNILTFNPTDARAIQKELKKQGISSFEKEADESGSGPDHFIMLDPDQNAIMFDQHE